MAMRGDAGNANGMERWAALSGSARAGGPCSPVRLQRDATLCAA